MVRGRKQVSVTQKTWAVLLLLVLLALAGCSSSKSSAVEGKLVDWNGKPVAQVKIVAIQIQPIKGYEQCEAVTDSNGVFTINGLFPSSIYIINPWSDKWYSEVMAKIESAPQGETALLTQPLQINVATNKDKNTVYDLATGATTRFSVSPKGVITDAKTSLQWVVGPNTDTNYSQAEQWVTACKVAGGGWRMPTKVELGTLYQQGVGERNMDPVFNTTGWYVWGEPRDSSSAWGFLFRHGVSWFTRDDSQSNRVFGVREN